MSVYLRVTQIWWPETGTYFGYLVDWLSEMNKQAFTIRPDGDKNFCGLLDLMTSRENDLLTVQ